MKKVILVMVVALVLSLLSVGVHAQTAPAKTGREEIPFQVNPLYEGVIDPADIAPEPEELPEDGGLSHTQPTFNSSRAVFVTEEEAIEQLRGYFESRTENFELHFKSNNTNYNPLIQEMMISALAHTGEPTEGDYLLWHFGGWGGNVDWYYSGGVIHYTYTLQVVYYTTAEQEKELDAAVSKLLKSLNLNGKSDYEKVCAVYDYICANTTYDDENLYNDENLVKYSAYGALINKTAVCQGYANLLYRLLLELGIDNRIITGETIEGPHAWNIVKLGDVYYNVDATWDAILGDHSYFLRNAENFWDHYRSMEYLVAEFQLEYPISATDYVDGVAGVPGFEPVWGVCGEEAMWVLDYDGVLTISGIGATDDYSKENNIPLWYYWQDCFDTVVIEEGITRIGAYSFYDMDGVVSVSMPDTLLSISAYVFSRCDGLRQITIPNSVTVIGGYAFFYCESLEEVTLSQSLEKINLCAFEGCAKLKQIQFPESLREIGMSAFSNCDSLRELTIPATVEEIEFSFRSCDSLEIVYFNGKDMDARDYSGCKNLQNVVFTDNLKGYTASYSGCDLITDLVVPASVTYFHASGSNQLETIRFLGNAPKMYDLCFDGVTATVYYPADNPTWTEDVMQQYGGNITWKPYDGQIPEDPEEPEEPDEPEEPSEPEVPAGVLGDVSGDGILDSFDATLILQYDVGMISEETIQLQLADVSGDGIVDSFDATLILQFDVGMIPSLPAV